MAAGTKLILINYDMNGNEIRGLKVEQLAADPSGGDLYEGRIWYNTTGDILKYRGNGTTIALGVGAGVATLTVDDSSIENTGTGTDPIIRVKALGITNAMLAGSIALAKLAVDPLARAGHTGSQAAATISDLATVVKAYRLDEFADPTSAIPMNGQKFTGLVDPADPQDSATKAYVDAVAAGLAPKDAVRAASAAAGTLASDFSNGDTIDGVSLVTGDRILIKNQAAPAENGIYIVAVGAPTRATDADSSADLIGAAVFVSEGTTNGNTLWVQTTDSPIVVDTTALAFAQFGGPGEYTASAGLEKVGIDFRIANSGVLPVANGGTNGSTVALAKASLGFMTRHAETFGDGAATSYVITHSLNTRDVHVSVYKATANFDIVECDVEITSVNTITLRFTVAPTSNQYRVVVIG